MEEDIKRFKFELSGLEGKWDRLYDKAIEEADKNKRIYLKVEMEKTRADMRRLEANIRYFESLIEINNTEVGRVNLMLSHLAD